MRIIMSTLLYMVVGAAMGTAGLSTSDWQFWIILTSIAIIRIIEKLPKKEVE